MSALLLFPRNEKCPDNDGFDLVEHLYFWVSIHSLPLPHPQQKQYSLACFSIDLKCHYVIS
jgi:hypothetical protein